MKILRSMKETTRAPALTDPRIGPDRPGSAIAQFCELADADTLLPVPPGYWGPAPTLGQARRGLIALASASLLWLLWAETKYLKRDLDTSGARALRLAAGGLVLEAVLVGGLLVTVAHLHRLARVLMEWA